jgi:hypothetical protein
LQENAASDVIDGLSPAIAASNLLATEIKARPLSVPAGRVAGRT